VLRYARQGLERSSRISQDSITLAKAIIERNTMNQDEEHDRAITVISQEEYLVSQGSSGFLFPTDDTSDWIAPDSPNPILTDLLHRGHRGCVTFHRLGEKNNENGKQRWQDLYSIKAKNVREHFARCADDLNHDSYFSIHGMSRGANYFSSHRPELEGALRNKSNIEFLTSCWVDIDCHAKGITVGQAIGAVIDASDNGCIPSPSIFLRSGRGLWLFWMLRASMDDPSQGESTHTPPRAFANRIATWTSIEHKILSIFAHVGSDFNCRDTARVTRVLGTLNTKAIVPTRTSIWLSCGSCNGSTEVVAYTLDELAARFNVKVSQDDSQWKKSPVAKISDPRYRMQGFNGAKILAQKRLHRFTMLVNYRTVLGRLYPIGKRRPVVLLYARMLVGSGMDEPSNLREAVDRFARNALQVGHDKDAFHIDEVLNANRWQRLRYSDIRIAEILEPTEDESLISGIPTLAQAIQAKSIRDARMNRTEKRSRRHLLIRQRSQTLANTIASNVAEIHNYLVHAENIEVSIRTVANDIGFLVRTGQVQASRFGRQSPDESSKLFAES